MDRSKNLEIVNSFGDNFQLEYGTEFGYYAKFLTREDIRQFCDKVNLNSWMQEHGYDLLAKYNYGNNKYCVMVRNLYSKLYFPIQLLDHSVFLHVSNEDWLQIEDAFFNIIMKEWQNILKIKVEDYANNLDKIIL